jgi:hypothetical protein
MCGSRHQTDAQNALLYLVFIPIVCEDRGHHKQCVHIACSQSDCFNIKAYNKRITEHAVHSVGALLYHGRRVKRITESI